MKSRKLKIVLLLALLFISSLSLYATENEVAPLPDLVRFVKEMGSYSFEEKSYTSTDALVFARLSYEPFQLLPEKETPYTIEEASAYLLNFPLFSKLVLIEWDDELLSACAASIRYKDVKILEFVSDTNNEEDKQFSAVTFSLSNGLLFLSFRGTDNTLVGWKEDFNMSFTSPVPSQEEAVKYTEKIASLYSGTLILTGHSKGGNIAKYAAAFSQKETQERIREVYSYDAPGFPDSVLNSEGYKRVRERIRVFVPESSIIGMLLSNDLNYVSVKVVLLQVSLNMMFILGRLETMVALSSLIAQIDRVDMLMQLSGVSYLLCQKRRELNLSIFSSRFLKLQAKKHLQA